MQNEEIQGEVWRIAGCVSKMALNFDRGFVPFRFVSFGLCLEGAFFRGGRCFGEFVPFSLRPFACAVRSRGRGIFPFGEYGKSGLTEFFRLE
ncbi:MAG: hypothetical protein II767_06600, partial [Proteobacteria bacterium]|nr:hypothetical protein [Pseudomonadota bacterium]